MYTNLKSAIVYIDLVCFNRYWHRRNNE